MAGGKGMWDKISKSPHYAESVRGRIKAGGIVFLLHKHIVGEREMSPTQVQAALGLLRKCVPDMASVEHKGEITHNYIARTPNVEANTEEWIKQYQPQALN